MGGADLAFVVGAVAVVMVGGVEADGRGGRRAVMLGHVGLEFIGVGSRGGFPAGFFSRGVEVVGQVFGVGVPYFPGGGEAGIGLRGGQHVCGAWGR